MVKIYYGNGICEIDSSDVKYCDIRIRYPIEIEDTTPYKYILTVSEKNNLIIIAKFRQGEGEPLKTLFNYEGNLSIMSANILNGNGDRESCIMKRVMDYSELLNSNAEDMTVKSEDLRATGIKTKRISKMKLKNPIIPDLESAAGQFYLQDGSEYIGSYHIHQDTTQRMSGANHTERSENLYFKEEVEGIVIDKLLLAKSTNYRHTKESKIRSTIPHKNRRRRAI